MIWTGDQVTDKADNLEDQLDALAEQCDPDNDAPSADGAGDLSGSDFADQVQKMLDEATASLDTPPNAAAAPPSAEPETDSRSETEPEESETSADDQLIGEIDDMLAEAADDSITGDFESIDEIEQAESGELPADPAAFGATESPEADVSPAGVAAASDEAAGVDGDFESVAEATMEQSSTDDQVNDEQEQELSDAAKAVAAELDADEAVVRDFESPDTLDIDEAEGDEPVIENVAAQASAPAAAPAEPKSATPPESDAQAVDEPAGEEDSTEGSSRLVTILAKINKPLDGVSETMKNVVGTVALVTLAMALACFVIAAIGQTAGLIVGMPIVMLVTIGAAYFLLIRGPGNGNNTPTSA